MRGKGLWPASAVLVRSRGVLDLERAVVRSRRLGRSAAMVLGPLAVSPREGTALPVAGGQAMPGEIACGVVEAQEASQRARRAVRPRRVPLWDDAGGREVHGPCGSTLGRTDTSACGRLLRMGVACGVARRAVALQEARRAEGPRRASLWENAEGWKSWGRSGGVPHGWNVIIKGAMVAAARLALIPSCARVLGNLA